MAEQATLVLESSWRRSRRLFPLEGETVIGGPHNDVDVGEHAFAVIQPMEYSIDGRGGGWRVRPCSLDVELDGLPLREETPLRHGQCLSVGYLRLWFLVGDLERALDDERHVRTVADLLTGTLRRSFLWTYLQRQAPPTAILMIDLDRFKNINDRYGMMGGDETLQRMAARIRGELAWPECAVRFGGEEFVVVLPGLAHAEAMARAERMRCACELSFAFEDETISATVSIGVAMLGADTVEALRAADDAMGRAKVGGRNRVAG